MAEARTKKLGNPFYGALLVVGVVFGVSAVAYVVMMVQMANPLGKPPTEGMVPWLNRHGTLLLSIELGALALLTVLSIATDDWWTGETAPTAAPSEKQASSDQPSESSP